MCVCLRGRGQKISDEDEAHALLFQACIGVLAVSNTSIILIPGFLRSRLDVLSPSCPSIMSDSLFLDELWSLELEPRSTLSPSPSSHPQYVAGSLVSRSHFEMIVVGSPSHSSLLSHRC